MSYIRARSKKKIYIYTYIRKKRVGAFSETADQSVLRPPYFMRTNRIRVSKFPSVWKDGRQAISGRRECELALDSGYDDVKRDGSSHWQETCWELTGQGASGEMTRRVAWRPVFFMARK